MSWLRMLRAMSPTAKRAYLETLEPSIKQAFNLALNPAIRFGFTIGPGIYGGGQARIDEALLDSLQGISKARALEILSTLSRGDAEILAAVLNKDLRCGVSAATALKIWPGLFTSWKVLKPTEWRHGDAVPAWKRTVFSEKLDGVRILFNADSRICRTSHGHVLSLPESMFAGVRKGRAVLDGELIGPERRLVAGLVTRARYGNLAESDSSHLRPVFFDIHQGTGGYLQRLATLESLVTSPENLLGYYSIVDAALTHADLAQQLSLAASFAWEGIIARDADAPWREGRTSSAIKLKRVWTISLRVTGYSAHSQDPALVGSLQCESASGRIVVSVASGLSDSDRLHPPPIGSIIEVAHNGETLGSLHAPRFICIREPGAYCDA